MAFCSGPILATSPASRLDQPIGNLLTKARDRGPGLLLGAVALALLLSALTGDRGLLGLWELDREVAEAERKNFELVQKISRVREESRAIQNDDATLERAARRQAHLVRPGEILYRLPPTNP